MECYVAWLFHDLYTEPESTAVVRRLLGDDHVVRVAFAHPGAGDAHEAGLLQGGHVPGAAVAHAGPQAAQVLDHDLAHGALVGHAAHDALGHQLLDVLFDVLEVAVLGTGLHGLHGSHAAVGLELAAFVDDGLAGGFLRAGEQGAGHRQHCVNMNKL